MSLYSINNSEMLLGILMNNPKYLFDSKYKLSKNDFKPFQAHFVAYVAIYNCAINGCDVITEVELDQWLQNYQSEYEVFKDFNGIEWVRTVKQLAKTENIDYYYTKVRRWSLIRNAKEIGINITDIFDESKSESEQIVKLERYEIKDLIKIFKQKSLDLEHEFLVEEDIEEYKAGESFSETKESLKDNPMVGYSFQSDYLNALFNGQYGFIFRSGKSGSGKSVASIGDMCKISATHYWDEKEQKFVENKSFMGASLYIGTEMSLKKQIDFMLVAWIANVDRKHIRKNRYDSKEQEERVDKAGEILKNSPIYCIDMPEFTCEKLEQKIEYYVNNKEVINVVFDYCQTQPFVNKEISKELGIPPREDLILLEITNRLKNLQRKLDFSLLSGSQLNNQEDVLPYVTEACLAGGKSQTRKLDGCMITLPLKNKEKKVRDEIDKRKGFNNYKANRITHMVKGRNNEYEEYIKVWHYLDMGTCRSYDICCTDKDNHPINVEKVVINNKKYT